MGGPRGCVRVGEGSREGVGGPRGWVEDPGGCVRVGEVSRGGGGVVPGCVGVPFTLPTGNLRRNSPTLVGDAELEVWGGGEHPQARPAVLRRDQHLEGPPVLGVGVERLGGHGGGTGSVMGGVGGVMSGLQGDLGGDQRPRQFLG